MNNYRSMLWPFIAALLLAMPLSVQANPPAELLLGNGKVISPGPYAKQALETEVDLSGPATGQGAIVLQLPGGRTVQLNRTGFERRSGASSVWRGQSPQDGESEAVITVHNGLMVGRIVLDNAVYTLQPGAKGKHLLQELDTEAFPACDSGAGQLVAMEGEPSGSEVAAAGEGTGTVIDLLSVYTPRVSSRLGGQAAAEAMIQAAVDNANAAFANSSMGVQYRLVHMQEVNYVTAGTTTDDLYWVTSDAGVAALRDQVGADMVSVIVDTSGSCGTGWVQRNPSAGFQSYAFQATDMDCAVGNLTFAHEHGHNMGMEHNPENSSVGGSPENASYDFSFAHYVDGSYRTVMSYSSPCSRGCSRVTRHSNPQSSYAGSPTGVSGERDNAQTGGLTAPIVSAFRDTTVVLEPGLNYRVVQSGDDVTEDTATGEMNFTDVSLAVGNDGGSSARLAGFRFTGVEVPAGASITRAYLELVAAASTTGSATAELSVVSSSDAAPFVNVAYDLSSKSLSSPVPWTMSPWSAGEASRTADISNLIQTVVDQSGWNAGGSIALVLNVSGSRSAFSYDGQPSQAPLLHIEFSEREPATNLAPNADFTVQATDLTANFADNSSDPDGSVTSWNWSFGDGNTAGVRNPSHAYTEGGTYQVSLEVMDDQGATHATSKDVTVLAPAPQVPDAPASLTATVQKSGKGKHKTITEVTLSWQHDSSRVDYLVLEGCLESVTGKGKNRQISCDWSVMAASVPGESKSIPAPSLEADYRYRIKAVNAVGESAWSNDVKI